MVQKKNTLTRTGIVALLACVCCILWGSAIPVIKTGLSSDGGGCGRYGESDCICRDSVYTGGTAGADICIDPGEKSPDSGSDDSKIRSSGVSGADGGTVFLLLHRCCPHFRSKREALSPDLATLLQS